MKKVMSVLLIAVMAAALMTISAFAAGSVDVSDGVAEAGGSATVTISANGVGSFTSLLGSLTYDSSKLTLTGIKAVGSVSGAQDVSKVTQESQITNTSSMYAWNPANGKVAYASGSDKSGTGQLFEVSFQVADGLAANTEIPVSVDVAFDDASVGLKDSGKITIDGGAEAEKNTYKVDLTEAVVEKSGVSGIGKVVKVSGNQPEAKKYVYIVVNYVRADNSTWAVAGTYSVDPEDGSFDIPSITGVSDNVASVLAIAVDSKVGAGWAGHNIASPVKKAPANA